VGLLTNRCCSDRAQSALKVTHKGKTRPLKKQGGSFFYVSG
jgi:hypothetical protein